MMTAGSTHLTNPHSGERVGKTLRGPRSIGFLKYVFIPGTWPAPTTATIFSPGASSMLDIKN